MGDFFEEIHEGDIHLRDKYQLELKSEYAPAQNRGEPSYTSEFFLFIPTQLQINTDVYTKNQFYRDVTSLIRYKTPMISLEEIIDSHSARSPLNVLEQTMKMNGHVELKEALFEFKLLGNIIRSQLRNRVREITNLLANMQKDQVSPVQQKIDTLCDNIHDIKKVLKRFNHHFFSIEFHKPMRSAWDYTNEFLSVTLEHYLSNLLDVIRRLDYKEFTSADEKLCQLIREEEDFRKRKKFGTQFDPKNPEVVSKAIYRISLLNKYIFDVLFLVIKRKEPSKKFTHIAASVAAGLAMSVYLILFTMQGKDFVIDSTAFIVFSVLLYIIKDRLKEGLRSLSLRLASKFFPDYTSMIQTPDSGETIGQLSEYFSFLENGQGSIPQDIRKVRDSGFKDELDSIKRQENVIYYRKDVNIWPEAIKANKRLKKVNDIFRYNLSQYLLKASDANDIYPYFNPETEVIEEINCSRVYHINIILKKTYVVRGNKKRIAFDRFRVILDKEGIKRVEKL
jgi:hypothetical protein